MVREAACWGPVPCWGWLRFQGERNSVENSSVYVDINELMVTLAEVHWGVSYLDHLMDEDNCFESECRQNYIQLTIKHLTSRHDVTSAQATQFPQKCPAAHQFSYLLVWKPAAQLEVVRWQKARHSDVHSGSVYLVFCSCWGCCLVRLFYTGVRR